jgi:hypothetical protein
MYIFTDLFKNLLVPFNNFLENFSPSLSMKLASVIDTFDVLAVESSKLIDSLIVGLFKIHPL